MDEISSDVEWAQKLKKELLNTEILKNEFRKQVSQKFYCKMTDEYHKDDISPIEFIEVMRTLVSEYDRCMKVWE